MPIVGLTGGIAAGKSTFAPLLLRGLPGAACFDSDQCVHDLLSGSDAVKRAIVQTFGPSVLDDKGRPDRRKLRDLVFADEGLRKALESILHPAVRDRRIEAAHTARKKGEWLLVDIPLLYETGVQGDFDRVIVVACPKVTQLNRLIIERGLALELAERIMATQMDIGAKTLLADHVIWNDSTVSNLDGQSQLLAAWLKQHYGRRNV